MPPAAGTQVATPVAVLAGIPAATRAHNRADRRAATAPAGTSGSITPEWTSSNTPSKPRTLKPLTTADGYDAEGSYSPDGKHFVFASFRDGDQEIYIADADGSHPRRITHTEGKDGGPFFSPDNQRICYRSDRTGSGNLQVFTNNVYGTDERALTGNDTFNWCPYWHPSGKWLIFTNADFRGRPNFDLYIVRSDGAETHRVTYDAVFRRVAGLFPPTAVT